MSIDARFLSHAEAKRAGWFSRRHETNSAHADAQARRISVEQKRKEGEERNTAWRSLTDKQKLASLDARLGFGKGALRQRKMLNPLLKQTL